MVEKNFNNMEIWKKLDEGLKYEYSISNTGKLRKQYKMVDGVLVKDGN